MKRWILSPFVLSSQTTHRSCHECSRQNFQIGGLHAACEAHREIFWGVVLAVTRILGGGHPNRESTCAGMPPKKKTKVSDQGQLKLCFTQSQSSSHVTTSDTVEESPQETVVVESADNAVTVVQRRENVANWRSFGDSKWRGIHPWLILKEDGVYCQFCSHANREVRSYNFNCCHLQHNVPFSFS